MNIIGVIFPVGYVLVNSQALDDQPWRQGAHPRQYQEYFDEVCADIVSLKKVHMPKGEHSRHHRVVQGEDREGKVSSIPNNSRVSDPDLGCCTGCQATPSGTWLA